MDIMTKLFDLRIGIDAARLLLLQDHRCLTSPRPPATALEAHALYAGWESRLPDLRRSNAVRLLESVIAHETFAFPPPTRFSAVIETHLFLAWPVNLGTTSSGQAQGRDKGFLSEGDHGSGIRGGGVDGGGGREGTSLLLTPPESFVVRPPEATRLLLEDALGLSGASLARGSDSSDAAGVASRNGSSGRTGSDSGQYGFPLEESVTDATGVGAAEGDLATCKKKSETLTAGGNVLEEKDLHDKQAVGRGGFRRGKRRSGGGGGQYVLPPEMQSFSRVYLGLYHNLAEAKGVPSGFKSRTTKSIDEGRGAKTVKQRASHPQFFGSSSVMFYSFCCRRNQHRVRVLCRRSPFSIRPLGPGILPCPSLRVPLTPPRAYLITLSA